MIYCYQVKKKQKRTFEKNKQKKVRENKKKHTRKEKQKKEKNMVFFISEKSEKKHGRRKLLERNAPFQKMV